jgi:hypothetical protein
MGAVQSILHRSRGHLINSYLFSGRRIFFSIAIFSTHLPAPLTTA